jgi:signal transduction histidine kinase
LKAEGERAIVLLENDTEYLSPEEGASLFKRFYTADSSRSQGSTGLGLSIARYLAEKMDGELYAEVTEPGPVRWLKIYLKLPRR